MSAVPAAGSVPAIDDFIPAIAPGTEPEAGVLAAGARAYLGRTHEILKERLRAGDPGAALNALHSDACDRLIRRLFEIAETSWFASHGSAGDPVSVAAVGGFARREMAPGSDVDLLFLVREPSSEFGAHIAERLQYNLWDAGVEVGAAIRTLDETLALARTDISACTAVLGVRHLAGDARLFHRLARSVPAELIEDVEAFIHDQQQAMVERHGRFGDSLYLLQPNLKEGAGGLRDHHTAMWVALASDLRVRDLDDLMHAGLLIESELADYKAALDFLWRVRHCLHGIAGRKSDQMSFELQEGLAEPLGYAGDEHELPVERFMGDYYRHARNVQTASEIVLEQCLARSRPRRTTATEPAEDGFRVADDHLEIPHGSHLRERPVRLLTAFAVAQDHEVPLSRTARRFIREHLHLIDEAFQSDPEASQAFLRILSSPHRVMRTLMAMNEIGLLGAYLPEWEHIVCRWQHVIYHTYTVDVHSIFLVEELRRLWRGKYEKALGDLTSLVRSVPDLPALYLGCLLHDIGKGFGGEHSEKGATRAIRCLERLGLPAERIDRIVFVVRYHLLMSHVAQRRDLSDPKVILDFARVVGDRQNLHNLYLATFADMRASSEKAWTPWRQELLRELFERTAELLEAGAEDPRRAAEQVEARVERRRAAAREELRGLGVAETRVEGFLGMMPRRYFVSHTPRQIARHAMVVLSLGEERSLGTSVREMRGDFSEFIICARDRAGLYGDVAGSLTAIGINILGSYVYTTRTGLALEIYRVTTPAGPDDDRRERWQRLDALLAEVLTGDRELGPLLQQRPRPIGGPRSPSRRPSNVSIRNDVSDFYTVVDITTDDRLGLLYDLAHTLADHGLEVFVSKATTVLDQVADTFYVKGGDQQKLLDEAAITALEADLWTVLSGPQAADA